MSKYILITGGELFNKGAQSMTFIAVNELKNMFPDKKIILLSGQDYERSEEYKNQYLFDILPINILLTSELLGGVYKYIWRLRSKKYNKKAYKSLIPKFKEILNNTYAIIDISGYALSSQWGITGSMRYLTKLILAKKYHIEVYIMPQSFGPFTYNGIFKIIINQLIKVYMRYPKIIFARENEGYKFLHYDYQLENVRKTYDLVLLNKSINLSNIYKVNPKIIEYKNAKDVAIVPNMRNFDHGNTEQIMLMYDIIINKLIGLGKTVCLVRHSYEDIEACKMIKNRFSDNNNVILIVDDMSCIEFDELIKKFDFLIGSRFHSIVHAYKNGIPCIAIGWATKYRELLETFKQEKYIFDVRNNIDANEINKSIDVMLNKYKEESNTILSILNEVQKFNVFDVIGEK